MTDPTDFEGPGGVDDERLLAELSRLAAERDPVPAELIDIAKQSFTWRTVDEELAEMVADSSSSSEFSNLVRSSTASVRLLTFATEHLRLELEILSTGVRRRLVGELSPPCRASISISHGNASGSGGTDVTDETDELGRFLTADVPAGWVRVRCEPAAESGIPALVTPWLKL